MGTYATAHVWKSEDNSMTILLPPLCGFQDQSQGARFAGQVSFFFFLNLASQVTGPNV